MTRRLEELELKKIHEVQVVAETPVQVKPCPICQSYEHLVEECPTIPAARKCLEIKQMSLDNSSPTTMLRMEILTTQIGGTIQISPGSQEHLMQEKGRFPSQPHQNPKGIHEVETHEGESSQVRDVKALITLRSVKSIPLLDMIKQVPTYAKFLKDLCTIKRGLNVNKKAFLTEQVSAIIQCKSPLKYKDPGCLHSVMIGGTVVEKALLDLGASVNLLPYSVYKQLGLGELKPTSITYL
ncbi:hypothetical protein CK203_050876 [Vitis vinifera]|uniref:Aspartic peptidase DDI1-type domain-containing protein n=1 Tax=Vitis vinifera TaxID=29760 RepID=A0A438GQZ0_VITVI|nr:hypothetical protein CK203_050876 [Vitis vinifera]